jgi:hypothetical protein
MDDCLHWDLDFYRSLNPMTHRAEEELIVPLEIVSEAG